MKIDRSFWKTLHWILLPLWVLGAILSMARVQGGFLTNYLSDLAFPPSFYIITRGLHDGRILVRLRWFAQTPERTAWTILLVGIVSEISQAFWPHGIFRGTFDLWDIAAYSVGVVSCYVLDKRNPMDRTPQKASN